MRLTTAAIILLLPFLIFNDSFAQQTQLNIKNPAVPYGNNVTAGKFYEVRGFKMYCEQYGKGQPLLIIHGNGGSIKDFVNQIPYFSAKFRVIVADSRAQGKSKDLAHDSLSYEMMADDYA